MTIARNQDSQPQGIKSIEVGARVLLALEQGRGPMALTEVARAADLHPAKVHRYLASLVRTGFASQNRATGLYDL
ncbi:MAG: helix-turn-helix domain-containing protein, partial [Solirubrobacterales bacterium]|nr:helix-turn-helix domain-containing protein [Solirubrobacterales bacterium]